MNQYPQAELTRQMNREALLGALIEEIKDEIVANPDRDAATAEVNSLVYIKHDQNSDHLRREFLVHGIKDTSLQNRLAEYTDIITHGMFGNNTIIQEAKESIKKKNTRRISVDFEEVPELEQFPDKEEDENLHQLKQRLLNGSKPRDSVDKTISTDQQLQIEEHQQEDILNDMFQFLVGIKEGANAFNERLNQDQNVLSAAEAGLQMTSTKLMKSRKNLSKTIQNIGLLDSLKLFGLVMFSFFMCLILIKLFPKW